MKVLNVRTVDSQLFKVDIDVLRQSQVLRTMLKNLSIGENTEDSEIPICNKEVSGEVFKKALIWMEKNRGRPDPKLNDKDAKWPMSEWEKNFINMPVSEMFPLLIAGKEFYKWVLYELTRDKVCM